MGKRKTKNKWLLFVLIPVLVCAVGAGAWYFTAGRNTEPVLVYPFQFLGMTEYWGDNQESYGPVTTDKIQTVFLSDTQQITEILVQAGDQVKKGDVLLRFDTTLSDLALEKKRLDVEKLKLQLADAQEELQRIKAMRPMVIPEVSPEAPEEDADLLGPILDRPYYIYPAEPQLTDGRLDYDGSSPDRALICWVGSGVDIGPAVLDAIRERAAQIQAHNALFVPGDAEEGAEGEQAPDTEAGEAPETGDGVAMTPVVVSRVYVVIKVTQGNRPLATKINWQGLVAKGGTGSFAFQFFSAGSLPDYSMELYAPEEEPEEGPTIDLGSGYTAAQLAQMRADQEKKIKELELSVRMAEAEYKLMELEVSDGAVYAQIDGTIISLLDPEEARITQQPVLKLSGGGGFFVEGFVSELEKDKLVIGQEVTVNDWNTGMSYPGTIYSLGDFPSNQGYYNGMGNPTTTYYPFLVFVDGSADLQEGRYVSIQYSSATAQNGIYLENPYLRTENGRTYVYLRGADGTLEKRYVTTGKSLWGSYTEILEGVTAEDLIAFPYGKQVRPGAPTQEGDMSDLYG